ncbi:MAG: acetylxylan esterase [Verrucomicrobia bacterium]|nr:acetylxylan esterase [Verrucomicrobiota bacterium]
MLAAYFRTETAKLAEQCLSEIHTLADWEARRTEYRRQLQEMLGLWPMPERTDLNPVITGTLEHEEFTVEKLHFQASPKLYVTANLYLPKKLERPAPAILYVCGHSRQFKDGVSFGNKTGYQHHGAWFARNGYVCLLIDTLQLGEIEGLHHGTHRLSQWWWNSRGYTPAGVEAWFGIRALDYLCSRPEVDAQRIGMTGRSGGGSYSWTVAALDDRVKVVAPIAGITDLQNQVVDGAVEGHCDCMFFVNTYRWDFAPVAALIAPRPLLIGNSDKDRIFPLDGVVRFHEQTRRVYQLYGKPAHLGLLITEGPHQDTQDLQVPVFRWFNRFLKGEEPLIEMAAQKFFEPAQLRVFDQLPADAVNTNIQSLFVPEAKLLATGELKSQRGLLLAALREKSFGGWPAENAPLDAKPAFSVEREGLKFSAWDFTSQEHVRLRLYLLEPAGNRRATGVVNLNVLDDDGWRNWLTGVRAGFADQLADELASTNAPQANAEAFASLKKLWATPERAPSSARSESPVNYAVQAFLAPRGVGLTAWGGDERKRTQIRRRFMLLGQTLDGMRVWDIRRAVQMIHFVRESESARVDLSGSGVMAVNAGFASLFEPGARLLLTKDQVLPETPRPDYLNVLKVVEFSQAMEMAAAAAE